MKDINLKNAGSGLCVVCGGLILTEELPHWQCEKCRGLCNPRNLEKKCVKGVAVVELKSDCCNANVCFVGGITCSSICHEELVIASEKEFGKFKKVVDSTTNIAYKVPTRDIIEKSLTMDDLPKYPMWGRNDDSNTVI